MEVHVRIGFDTGPGSQEEITLARPTDVQAHGIGDPNFCVVGASKGVV